jgi:hypothetical protein
VPRKVIVIPTASGTTTLPGRETGKLAASQAAQIP